MKNFQKVRHCAKLSGKFTIIVRKINNFLTTNIKHLMQNRHDWNNKRQIG